MDKMTYNQVEGILYNYNSIKASIISNKIRLDNLELEDPEDGVSAISYGEQGSKTNKFNSIVENATMINMQRLEKAKRELKRTIRYTDNKIKMIDNAMEILPETEKQILKMYYIDGYQWRDVANELNYSTRQCINLRKEAIENMLLSINGEGFKI